MAAPRLGLSIEISGSIEQGNDVTGAIEPCAARLTHGQAPTAAMRRVLRDESDYLDELCVLLNIVGWAIPRRQTAAVIDLSGHRRAVTSALDFALASSTDELEDAENAKPAARDAIAQRSVALRQFTDAVAELTAAIEQEEEQH
jgi:hypothetical protein